MADLSIVIISGLSGSGKSHAIKCFEDIGFFCVDNLPPALIPKFVDLCTQSGQDIRRVALGIDLRERDFFKDFSDVFRNLRKAGKHLELLFIEADDETILRRFSETRRPHPLAPDRTVLEGVRLERERLMELRDSADRIIDTTAMTVHELKAMLRERYRSVDSRRTLRAQFLSFGFKYGIPYDADMIFDVRFLKNPNFSPALKPMTGRDREVREYVFSDPEAGVFFEKIRDMADYLLPLYVREERSYVTIAIGCTGGRHRSVAMVESLKDAVTCHDVEVSVRHRDLER